MKDRIARWLLARFPRPVVILIMATGLIAVCGFFILLFAITIGILMNKPVALAIIVTVLLTSIAYVFIDEQLPRREKKE